MPSSSKLFLHCSISFLTGIACSTLSLSRFSNQVWLTIFLSILGVLIINWRILRVRQFLFYVFFICLGAWRSDAILPGTNNITNYAGRTMTLEAVISTEPDLRMDRVSYIAKVQQIKNSGTSDSVSGKIYIRGPLYPRYDYGDRVSVDCALRRPEPPDLPGEFRFDMYLARQGVYVVCASPKIEKISGGEGNFILRTILSFKKLTAEKIVSLWPEPQASFAAGLLYGYRGGLGRLSEDFANAGVTHIVAVSGYNISIVAGILATMCIYLLIPRKRAFGISVGAIVIFVIFTGASASVVRAGIMGIFTLCGSFFGRSRSLTNSIVGAAVLMTVWNPYSLLWDLGLQLSFLATIGLVWLSPFLKEYFNRVPEYFGLRENLTNTTAAILITTPVIMYSTGRMSPYAIVANLLILWTIPYLMLGAFVSTAAAFVSRLFAGFLGFITYLGLMFVSQVVQTISHLPFSSFTIRLPWYGMIMAYVGIFWGWHRLNLHVKTAKIISNNK